VRKRPGIDELLKGAFLAGFEIVFWNTDMSGEVPFLVGQLPACLLVCVIFLGGVVCKCYLEAPTTFYTPALLGFFFPLIEWCLSSTPTILLCASLKYVHTGSGDAALGAGSSSVCTVPFF